MPAMPGRRENRGRAMSVLPGGPGAVHGGQPAADAGRRADRTPPRSASGPKRRNPEAQSWIFPVAGTMAPHSQVADERAGLCPCRDSRDLACRPLSRDEDTRLYQNKWPSKSTSPSGQACCPRALTIMAPGSACRASPNVTWSSILTQEQRFVTRAHPFLAYSRSSSAKQDDKGHSARTREFGHVSEQPGRQTPRPRPGT